MRILGHAATATSLLCIILVCYRNLAVFNRMNDFGMGYKGAFVNKRILDGVLACARDISEIEPLRQRGDLGPLNLLRPECAELRLQRLNNSRLVRQIVFYHVVETTEKCAVEYAHLIGC